LKTLSGFNFIFRRYIVTSKSNGFSVIDNDMDVEGSLSCNGRLVVRGSIKGSIRAESVVISDNGIVVADTKVKSMVIGGKFEGDITAAQEVTILSTGICSGKVECKNLVIEAGGIINAEVNSTFVKESLPEETPIPLNKNKNQFIGKLQTYFSSFFRLNTAKSGK
jgi:cytoskeletal protein CcmA (bactofilin family)